MHENSWVLGPFQVVNFESHKICCHMTMKVTEEQVQIFNLVQF